MRKSVSSLALFLSLTTNVFAGDYTVQVGAFESISTQAIERAQQHGETFQRVGNDNLERLSIGRFTSRAQAEDKRDQLHVSGYSDAFVSILDSRSSTAPFVSKDVSSTATRIEVNNTLKSNYSIDDLSNDERIKASYLDGQLRILSNGQFYTVEQYRATNQY